MTSVSSAPRAKLRGVRDDSIRQVAPVSEQLPTHLPWLLTYAPQGGENVEFVDGGQFDALFGAQALNLNGPYATHTTPFIKGGLGTGTILAVQRVFPKDIYPEATLAFSLDILPTQIVQYQRDSLTGAIKTDVAGNKIPLVVEGVPVTRPGYKIKWVVEEAARLNKDGEVITDATADKVPVANSIGTRDSTEGDQADPDSEAISTRYPIFDGAVSFKGFEGNNRGLRLFAAHDESMANETEILQERLGEFLFGIQQLTRINSAGSAIFVPTLGSSPFALCGVPELLVDETSNLDYGHGEIMGNWNADDSFGRTIGPFNKFFVYEDYVREVQALIATAEEEIVQEFTGDDDYTLDPKRVNFVDFKNIRAIPYRCVEQLGHLDGGSLLNNVSTFFAAGGTDGTMNAEKFEELALEQFQFFGSLPGKHYRDYVRFPFHQVYDSGYSHLVKNAIPTVTAKRLDMLAILSTQDSQLPINSSEEDSSALVSLVSRARQFPESALFGTGNFRTIVAQQAGRDASRLYRGTLPLVYELFIKYCAYMGAANGRWNTAKRPDVYPNNVVSLITGLQHTYKDDRQYENDWNAGGIWAISNDRKTDMIAAMRTVCADPTSILVSAMNAFVFGDLEYLCNIAWRRVVGDSTLTKSERLEKQEKVMNDLIRERGGYDGRVQIQLRAYYTGEDDLNGFSSHLDVTVGGNALPTVQTFTLIAQRLEDLPA